MASYAQPQKLSNWYQRGRANTVTLLLIDASDGKTAVVPSAGKYSLFDPNGVVVAGYNELAVSFPANLSTVTVTPPTSAQLGKGWLERWDMTIAGEQQVFERGVTVVLRVPSIPLQESDITEGRNRNLAELLATAQRATLADYINAAWIDVCTDLINNRAYPYQLLEPGALYVPMLAKIEELVYRDAARGKKADDGHRKDYEDAQSRYTSSFRGLTADWDKNDDGKADGSEQGLPVVRMGLAKRNPRGW